MQIYNFSLNTNHKTNVAKMQQNTIALNFRGALTAQRFDSFEKESPTRTFTLSHKVFEVNTFEPVEVTQNLNENVILYKKVFDKKTGTTRKIPFSAGVASSKNEYTTTYYFIDNKTKQELGFVAIDDWQLAQKLNKLPKFLLDSPLLDDFPELGITKDRVNIGELQNNFEESLSGIGEAADQIAIEYCLKHGLTPNVVSVAALNSHAAHYMRGRRFFEISKNDKDIDYYEFKKKYNTTNPNEIIEQRIKETPKENRIYTDDLGNLYMYMPKEIVAKYLKRIKQSPILID